jgi:hypothetical protein
MLTRQSLQIAVPLLILCLAACSDSDPPPDASPPTDATADARPTTDGAADANPVADAPPTDAPSTPTWVLAFGNTNNDRTLELALDNNGDAIVAGTFESTVDFGGHTLTASAGGDTFVAKVSAAGKVKWVVACALDYPMGMAVDNKGDTYLTGYDDGKGTCGSHTLSSAGGADIFAIKVSAAGKVLWVRTWGGSGWDTGGDVAVDDKGNVYVSGYFEGTASFGTASAVAKGKDDLFVVRLDAQGAFKWLTTVGGAGWDKARTVAAVPGGGAVISGSYQQTVTFGGKTFTSKGSSDVFISKLDDKGQLVWTTVAGGSSSFGDWGRNLAIDSSGAIFLTGSFSHTATFGTQTLTAKGGNSNLFAAALTAAGAFSWVTSHGNTASSGYGIHIGPTGDLFVSAAVKGQGQTVIRYSTAGKELGSLHPTGTTNAGTGLGVDKAGYLFVAGGFFGAVTFGKTTLTSKGGTFEDAFLWKTLAP